MMKQNVPELFGSMVFDDREMRARLTADVYSSLRRTIDENADLEEDIADAVASEIEPVAADKLPVSTHDTVGSEVVIFTIQRMPSVQALAVPVEICPSRGFLHPVGFHSIRSGRGIGKGDVGDGRIIVGGSAQVVLHSEADTL